MPVLPTEGLRSLGGTAHAGVVGRPGTLSCSIAMREPIPLYLVAERTGQECLTPVKRDVGLVDAWYDSENVHTRISEDSECLKILLGNFKTGYRLGKRRGYMGL